MKIASRYLIPLELVMAVMIISWGFSGWLGGGALARTLATQDLDTAWGAALCGVGLAQLVAAATEQFFGRRWDDGVLLFSVTVRFWIAFVATAVWFYVCYLLVQLRGVELVISLGLQAPAALGFSIWICIGNRKVGCVLDPRIPTERLKRAMRLERSRLLEH